MVLIGLQSPGHKVSSLTIAIGDKESVVHGNPGDSILMIVFQWDKCKS